MDKEEFLKSIKSQSGDSKYKRVVVSPLRYAGGKSLAVGHLLEKLPVGVKKIVSPFFGGGSFELACNIHLGIDVVGYDIFDILTNYWQWQINDPKILAENLQLLKPTQEEYDRVKTLLKSHWKGEATLDSADLAAFYFFNHNLSYGPGFLGWPSKMYLDEKRYERILHRVRSFDVKGVSVSCGRFEDTIIQHKNDFLYLDPPYYIGEGSKMFRGIYPMRNIPVHHNGFNHELLRDLLKEHKGGFLMSYTNCQIIRSWYQDYELSYPTWQYTMGQGEKRIGANRLLGGAGHIKESHEILIYCPPK